MEPKYLVFRFGEKKNTPCSSSDVRWARIPREPLTSMTNFKQKKINIETEKDGLEHENFLFQGWKLSGSMLIFLGLQPNRDINPTEGVYIYLLPWQPTTFIFRGYDPYVGGVKPSFFMVLGSKGIRIPYYRWGPTIPNIGSLFSSIFHQPSSRWSQHLSRLVFLRVLPGVDNRRLGCPVTGNGSGCPVGKGLEVDQWWVGISGLYITIYNPNIQSIYKYRL